MKIRVLFTVFSLFLLWSCTNSTIDKEQTNFAVEDTSIIDSIIIKDTNTIILSKNNGLWHINSLYIADDITVTKLLNTIKLLKMKTPLPENAVDIVAKEIKTETFVVIYSQNKILKSYYIGKYTKGSGNYILLNESKTPYIAYIPSFDFDLKNNFTTDNKKWISTVLFALSAKQIKKINFVNNSEKKMFFINKETDKFAVSISEKDKTLNDVNYDKVLMYIDRFKNVKFENFFYNVDQGSIDSLLKLTPIFEIEVQTNDLNTINLKAFPIEIGGKTDKDNFIGLLNNQDLILAKYYDFDLLLKDYSYFLNK